MKAETTIVYQSEGGKHWQQVMKCFHLARFFLFLLFSFDLELQHLKLRMQHWFVLLPRWWVQGVDVHKHSPLPGQPKAMTFLQASFVYTIMMGAQRRQVRRIRRVCKYFPSRHIELILFLVQGFYTRPNLDNYKTILFLSEMWSGCRFLALVLTVTVYNSNHVSLFFTLLSEETI